MGGRELWAREAGVRGARTQSSPPRLSALGREIGKADEAEDPPPLRGAVAADTPGRAWTALARGSTPEPVSPAKSGDSASVPPCGSREGPRPKGAQLVGRGRSALPRVGHGNASRNAGRRQSFRRRDGEKPDDGGEEGAPGGRQDVRKDGGPRAAGWGLDSFTFARRGAMPRFGPFPERKSSARRVAMARPPCVTRWTHSMSADGGDHDLESWTAISSSGEPGVGGDELERPVV